MGQFLHGRSHKERAQPAGRRHLGRLEKKKDYRLRARAYHRREDRLAAMERRAEGRNPDEFYYGMHGASTERGSARGSLPTQGSDAADLDAGALRLLQTQDARYTSTVRRAEAATVATLRADLSAGAVLQEHGVRAAGGGWGAVTDSPQEHTLFVDSDADVAHFDLAERLDTLPELVGRRHNRPRRAALASGAAAPVVVRGERASGGRGAAAAGDARAIERGQRRARKELAQREARVRVLAKVEAQQELEKALTATRERGHRAPHQRVVDEDTGDVEHVWRFKRRR